MSAILLDSRNRSALAAPALLKTAVAGLIILASLGLAGLGAFWLAASEDPPPAPVATPLPRAAQPAAAEPLIPAPAPSCIDGRPARAEGPVEACA